MVIPLIREARCNIGDFKCQLKSSTPNYDSKAFAELVVELDDGGDVILELLQNGHIKKLELDPSSANYFAQHPEAAEYFKEAWRDSQELTPAITSPKF